jgi:hypothetical protein
MTSKIKMGGPNLLHVDCLACGNLTGGHCCAEHGNGCVPLDGWWAAPPGLVMGMEQD